MGSLGDDFDGRIPTEGPAPSPAGATPRPRALPRERPGRKPEVLLFSNLAPTLVVLALLWQTPGHQVRSTMAFAAVLVAACIVLLLHTRFRGMRGAWRNYAAILVAIPFLAIPEREFLDRPLRNFYASTIDPVLHPPGAGPKPSRMDGLAQRREAWAIGIAETRRHMAEVAELAGHIAVECEPDKVIVVGGQAKVSSSPQWAFYEYVPVLRFRDDCVQAYLRRQYGTGVFAGDDPVSKVPAVLRDRFSPEGRWLYGTYVKGETILVWSPGPDGRMDFSPLKEFRADDPRLSELLLLKSYDPTNGMMSSGDLIVVEPLPEPEQLGF